AVELQVLAAASTCIQGWYPKWLLVARERARHARRNHSRLAMVRRCFVHRKKRARPPRPPREVLSTHPGNRTYFGTIPRRHVGFRIVACRMSHRGLDRDVRHAVERLEFPRAAEPWPVAPESRGRRIACSA